MLPSHERGRPATDDEQREGDAEGQQQLDLDRPDGRDRDLAEFLQDPTAIGAPSHPSEFLAPALSPGHRFQLVGHLSEARVSGSLHV